MSLEEVERRIGALPGVLVCRAREASAGTPWTRAVLLALEVRRAIVADAGSLACDALRTLREVYPSVQGGRLRISWRDEGGMEHRTRPREWVRGTPLEHARWAANDLVYTREWLDEAVPA